ncbi:MAG TPA: non-ribosomal peptide synthetase [Candidatus Angelobacter sp.]
MPGKLTPSDKACPLNETSSTSQINSREEPRLSRSLVNTASSFCYPPTSQSEAVALASHSKRAFASDRFVPQLVSDHARQNPGRIALIDDSMQLTYGELDDRANRLADRLKSLGVIANTVVAVCMRRSSLTVVAAFAVLKAGGAYLPLDPNYPQERLAFILADAKVPIVLSDSTVADRLPGSDWQLILLDSEDLTGRAPTTPQTSQICPDHLAYVIYTSGSTGTPKGVEITHENLLNFVFWHRKAFAVSAEDRGAQFVSFGFDVAVAEMWPQLTTGAAVQITPEEVRSSPELLKEWLTDQEITIAFVPSPMAERLIMLNWPTATKLRLLLTGGDTLHRYPRPGLPFALINNYGPTETTVVATFGAVATERREPEQRPSIGLPIDGAEVYIVDSLLNPMPRGEAGELCIGGAGVGRGYVKSPELTAKKFVPHPFVNRPGARLYRTGDLARWLPNGEIEYIGRLDDLIKIRGFRVEPSEITAVLNTHPAVQASAVILRQNGADSHHLVAYVVLNSDEACPTATELRGLLRKLLPDYMIPAVFVVLPDLPLTSNGKLDRKALPAPDSSTALPNENYLSPRTMLEEKLSAVASNLLGITQVGVNDNFFLIGGHSLFATQLIQRIWDDLGVDLPFRSVFESPTPALLAQEIQHLISKIGT